MDRGSGATYPDLRGLNDSFMVRVDSTSHKKEVAAAFRRPESLELHVQHAVKSVVGSRGAMEDRSDAKTFAQTIMDPNMPDCESHYAIFSVFDGHGGVQVAEYAQHALPLAITATAEWKRNDIRGAIIAGYAEVENTILTSRDMKPECGTTVTMALIHGNVLYISNVGDGQAVLSRNGTALVLSTMHRACYTPERLRVENLGGVVRDGRLHHPTWNGALVNLAVTRSLGDAFFKRDEYTRGVRSGLIAEPSIQEVVLQVVDEFVLLATDGYWDVVSPENAVVFVSNMLQRRKDPALICSELTQMATLRGTCDNCTVMLLTLKQRPVPTTNATTTTTNSAHAAPAKGAGEPSTREAEAEREEKRRRMGE